ncbi:hypothetical protein V8G54_000534 [Vigna mungo]|uniref:Uncharacterized protein n=1 Tax=Vigna mungo TaxID=3915 RepID=A0AAQ3P5F6_VIGMU
MSLHSVRKITPIFFSTKASITTTIHTVTTSNIPTLMKHKLWKNSLGKILIVKRIPIIIYVVKKANRNILLLVGHISRKTTHSIRIHYIPPNIPSFLQNSTSRRSLPLNPGKRKLVNPKTRLPLNELAISNLIQSFIHIDLTRSRSTPLIPHPTNNPHLHTIMHTPFQCKVPRLQLLVSNLLRRIFPLPSMTSV